LDVRTEEVGVNGLKSATRWCSSGTWTC